MSVVANENRDPDLSPTSPGEDSDAGSPAVEADEPIPGLDGVPVRCAFLKISMKYSKYSPMHPLTGYDVSSLPTDLVICGLKDPIFCSSEGGQNGTVYTYNAVPREARY
jgi:hypothetical protein